MSRCSDLARAWITDRMQTKGRTRDQAFAELIGVAEGDIDDLEKRVQSLRMALEDESEEYSRFRLEPFYIAIEREISLVVAARELEKSDWRR